MSDAIFLQPHHVTVGYTGVPGERSFFLQVEDDVARVTLLLEKGQVEGIGELLGQVLARVEDSPATDWDRDAMALRPPIDAEWRVGEIGLGVDPDGERVVLELAEIVADETLEPSSVQVSMDRDQARRLSAHAQETVTQGRPRCELCGRPTGLDGEHICPSTNGHGALSR